ncbi:EamA family transporter [Rhodobacter sp. SGA-6-6]|uniref:aromatic amino acid exporter YddG n=1 Tax=Rhodobacter sp. SGA-6-6 TaxID=2710882 RepID=UPI0013EA21ED|nr:EamA family transporter [Rhodobacter sp. SGA-6-6]NGM44147.1 EamA family transporter [Rhodobacter sp. SGA-6-6]
MTRNRATAIGFTAILMWSALALLTIRSAPVPPLLLNALCFAVGGVLGLIWTVRRGVAVLRGVSWKVYAFGAAGLFGYHFLYFTAFRLSPTAETGLIAYLWPLFIVLFSGLLPGERLAARHILGALVAFSGAAVILLGRDSEGTGTAAGFALAFACALTWAGYSVLSRRMGAVPTEAVTVFCLATAILSALAHLAVEETAWPEDAAGWLAVLGLGLGPVGAAFFTWDVGMKKGDIQVLGVASYAAPLLSTLALVAAGIAEASWTIALAALLITGGAAIAARKGAVSADPATGG